MITRKEMTRMLLKEGLLSCLANHSFESVTVTLLCKASGITRSTFYLHYSNIMEIVDDLVDDAISYSRPGMVDNNNLQIIAKTFSLRIMRCNTYSEICSSKNKGKYFLCRIIR